MFSSSISPVPRGRMQRPKPATFLQAHTAVLCGKALLSDGKMI